MKGTSFLISIPSFLAVDTPIGSGYPSKKRSMDTDPSEPKTKQQLHNATRSSLSR